MVNIRLYINQTIQNNVKMRQGFDLSTGEIASVFGVNIGNFSNLNLIADNSVEISVNYDLVLNSNFVVIESANPGNDGFLVIGQITDVEYINDTNTRVGYIVDPFTSARLMNKISLNGMCERVNFSTPSMPFANLQSEPFSPSDVITANTGLTQSFNDAIYAFEGVNPGPFALQSSNFSYVLTVSPAIIDYLGISGNFESNPTGFPQTLLNRTNLNFYANDTSIHSGGTFRGTPIKFENIAQVRVFIKRILGGCGFRTVLPPEGYSGQDAVNYRQYLTEANIGVAVARSEGRNTVSDPMENIRFITVTDIYNLYLIPTVFALNMPAIGSTSAEIQGFRTLAGLHFTGEDIAKSKLICYPYYYTKIVTANGDTQNIYPQTAYKLDSEKSTPVIEFVLKFQGGDTPRLMGKIVPRHDGSIIPWDQASTGDWFTIRNYPAITLSMNDSYNPQIQRDVGNTRKLNAMYMNSITTAQMDNPFKQGYTDGINGNNVTNNNSSYVDNMLGKIGQFAGSLDRKAGNSRLFQDTAAQSVANEFRSTVAGNFVKADVSSIMGNDFIGQMSVPAIMAYDGGATNAELFAFSRYLEAFGSTCNSWLDPIANNNVLTGVGVIAPVNGRTYYQFSFIDVIGTIPISWKNSIKSLFEGGVYLV